MLVCWVRGRGAPFSAPRTWTGGDVHPRHLPLSAARTPQAARHAVSSRRCPTGLSEGGASPTPSSFAGGGVSWPGAVPCGTHARTRPSGSGAAWVPQAGKQTQTQRECPFRRERSARQQGGVWWVSWGRMLSGLCTPSCAWSSGEGRSRVSVRRPARSPGEGRLRVSPHVACAQAAHPRRTGAESTLTSPRPGGVPCGRSAHTCAMLAPRGPPLPALLVPQPLLHDRCSPVDVNLPHLQRPRSSNHVPLGRMLSPHFQALGQPAREFTAVMGQQGCNPGPLLYQLMAWHVPRAHSLTTVFWSPW